MATKTANKLKLVEKASAEVIARATEELAPHGLAYEPPPYETVLQLIKQATIEAVDRRLRNRKEDSWLLEAVRELLGTCYPRVWDIAETGRGLRSRAEQNAIFKLNYYTHLVLKKMTGEKVDHDWHASAWDLYAWKAEQRKHAEWNEAKASLPAKHRNNIDHVMWVQEEKKMREGFAKADRYMAKIRKKRIADGTLASKDLKAFDASRAKDAVEREKKLERSKRWRLATVEERGRMRKAEDAARKKKAKK